MGAGRMVFLDAVVAGFSNYANFRGRATRAEYWYFTLFVILGSYASLIIDRGVFGFAMGPQAFPITPFYTLYWLATVVPGLAVSFRRIHDIGRSAWWLLFVFIPIIGVFILLYWYCRKGDDGSNAYGPPSTFGT